MTWGKSKSQITQRSKRDKKKMESENRMLERIKIDYQCRSTKLNYKPIRLDAF